ncbi:MAG TPA: histidinol-phosphate transaminase [Clostridia bacterium]|nr:histidinol-phosphate transaminase [Clostridia bacterium]
MKQYHPPLGGRTGLRMDFNENISGCSPRVLAKLRTIGAELLNRYPERQPAERIAAEFLKLQPEQALLTNGVDEAIHLLAETYLELGDEALIVVPTFSMYEIYVLATGATLQTVQAGADFMFPTSAVLQAINEHTKLIAIANPNNPTGAAVANDVLLQIAKAAPSAAVLVDEAYFDFYGTTLVGEIGRQENLFVARTFSKAYGLAGFRMGVLAGSTEQMHLLRRVGSPYNVNGVALACLPEALADREFVANYVAQVRRGRERLAAEFDALGIRRWPSEANFVLGYFGRFRKSLVEEMRRRGILVRDRNGDPGCAGCIRITVGTDAQTDVLIEQLRAALESVGFKPEEKKVTR